MSQVATPRTASAPTTAAAMTQGLVPPDCDAGTVDVVVDCADIVVVVVVRAEVGPDEAARKATTCSAEGASRRPAPTEGVGKWFAGAPMVA
jgi:hypothetical protein